MMRCVPVFCLFCGLVSASLANAAVYSCTFKAAGRDPYVSKSVTFDIDAQKMRATVFDALVANKHGGPIPARITNRDSKSWSIFWEVEVPFKKNRTSQADYQVIFRHTKGTASMTAHIPGNFEPSRGRGTCKQTG